MNISSDFITIHVIQSSRLLVKLIMYLILPSVSV